MYDLFTDDLFTAGIDFSGTAPNVNFRIFNNVLEIWDIGTNSWRQVFAQNGSLTLT